MLIGKWLKTLSFEAFIKSVWLTESSRWIWKYENLVILIKNSDQTATESLTIETNANPPWSPTFSTEPSILCHRQQKPQAENHQNEAENVSSFQFITFSKARQAWAERNIFFKLGSINDDEN